MEVWVNLDKITKMYENIRNISSLVFLCVVYLREISVSS